MRDRTPGVVASSRNIGTILLTNPVNLPADFQTVGDAISDMLLVETVLHAKGWSAGDWISAYDDLPNRQGPNSIDNLHA